jgi:hypothetical protein
MGKCLHITSGDIAGAAIAQCTLPGELLVWHDILYDGPREPGWPTATVLAARAVFIEGHTGGGLDRREVLKTLQDQYARLRAVGRDETIVLWVDACLFDQSMLCHLLVCLQHLALDRVELLCVDRFPGIVPYHGLGQLTSAQLASVYDRRRAIMPEQSRFAREVDSAFARQDRNMFRELAALADAPLPWVPAAAARWLEERPDAQTGLGRLARMALDAIRTGSRVPGDIFRAAAAAETPPQYWGDTTLWAEINALADRQPPLVRIEGPARRLPQWPGGMRLEHFRVYPMNLP